MRRPSSPFPVVVALMALTAFFQSGCADESAGQTGSQDGGPPPHEFAVTPYGVKACDTVTGQLTVRRELRLFANRDIDIEKTATALQRYYRRYGITFYQVRPIVVVDTAAVQDYDAASLTKKLAAKYPGTDLSEPGLEALAKNDPSKFARLTKDLLNMEFAGALEFMSREGGTGQDATNIVVLSELFTPGTDKETREMVLGISISPFLVRQLQSSGMDESGAFSQIDFPRDFTPTVFISEPNVKSLETQAGPIHRDLVLAHEFGHSAGLVHREDPGNLMNPSTDGTERCSLTLTADQIAVMREGLGIAPSLQPRLLNLPTSDTVPAPLPSLVAGVLSGDPQASRKLLAPFYD